MRTPVTVLVGGLDPTGTAGIAVDIGVVCALGVHPAPVVTVSTAQTTARFDRGVATDAGLLRSQLEAVVGDLVPRSAKLGMLWSADLALAVADAFVGRVPSLVVDPVLVSGAGSRIVDVEIDRVYRELLIPNAWIVTPNRAEAALLTGMPVNDATDALAAAEALVEAGAASAVVTGGSGHGTGDEVVDAIAGEIGRGLVSRPRVGDEPLRGSGDALSAALAAFAALGVSTTHAYRRARPIVERAIDQGLENPRGKGRPAVAYARPGDS